jgi:hypothetical protein
LRDLRVLSAEGAVVSGVLGHLHLLDHLTEGGSVSGAIFTADPNLLRVLSL